MDLSFRDINHSPSTTIIDNKQETQFQNEEVKNEIIEPINDESTNSPKSEKESKEPPKIMLSTSNVKYKEEIESSLNIKFPRLYFNCNSSKWKCPVFKCQSSLQSKLT